MRVQVSKVIYGWQLSAVCTDEFGLCGKWLEKRDWCVRIARPCRRGRCDRCSYHGTWGMIEREYLHRNHVSFAFWWFEATSGRCEDSRMGTMPANMCPWWGRRLVWCWDLRRIVIVGDQLRYWRVRNKVKTHGILRGVEDVGVPAHSMCANGYISKEDAKY